ncbi:glycosyltransferase [Geodermatophilus sp. SYSU D00700]
MKVAILHDYVTQRGGAERVVLSMLRAFPGADLWTLLYEPSTTYPEFSSVQIRTSPLNRVPFFRRHHRVALPLLALAAWFMRPDADVVICSSSGWSHGMRSKGRRIVYCYSPARWLYQPNRYLTEDSSRLVRWGLGVLGPALRNWDRRSARKATTYLSISTVVRDRVRQAYGLESSIVPAPQTIRVDGPLEPVQDVEGLVTEGYDLCISRLLPYKRVDVVVDAFSGSGRRLIVVGQGPEKERLERHASSEVVFLSGVSDAQIRWLYTNCRAVVSASYEDFGLTPLEAAAFGKPAIVPREGGFLDTVIDGETGLLFADVSAQGLRAALAESDVVTWNAERLRAHAADYSEERFIARLREVVRDVAT